MAFCGLSFFESIFAGVFGISSFAHFVCLFAFCEFLDFCVFEKFSSSLLTFLGNFFFGFFAGLAGDQVRSKKNADLAGNQFEVLNLGAPRQWDFTPSHHPSNPHNFKPTSHPTTHHHLCFGYKMPVRHVPLGSVSAAAKDRAILIIHTNHSINTCKHPTPTPLGKHTQEPWLYPPLKEHLTSAAHPASTTQVGVLLVALFHSLFKQSSLRSLTTCLT